MCVDANSFRFKHSQTEPRGRQPNSRAGTAGGASVPTAIGRNGDSNFSDIGDTLSTLWSLSHERYAL